jgi:predicted dehydrogenase
MKFALLGIDDEALQLAQELARSDEHSLRYFAPATETTEVRSHIAEVRRLCPLAEVLANWEYLLAPQGIDAVIVAGPQGAAGRFEQMRRFIQEGVPLIVTHPPAVALLEAYELEMVRQEFNAPVWSLLLPWRERIWTDSGFLRTRDPEVAGVHCGPVEQLTCERFVADTTRVSVLAQLARDVNLIRELGGEVIQVATLGGIGQQELQRDLSSLTVQMTTEQRVLVRWSVEPVDEVPGLRLTLTGPQGKHQVDMMRPADVAIDQVLYTIVEQGTASGARAQVEDPPSRLEVLVGHLRALQGDFPFPSNWPEAIRSLEIVEAVEKSLKKGRTISVGVEGRTETDAFKGTMASVGCVLLIVGLLVVIGSAVMLKIAEKVGNQALVSIFRWWPALLVGVFGVFLVLQLLRFIIPEASKDNEKRSP